MLRSERPPAAEDEGILKLYSERLVNKLEKKMLDLGKALAERERAEWEREVAEIRDRINVAGMTPANIDRLSDAVADAFGEG